MSVLLGGLQSGPAPFPWGHGGWGQGMLPGAAPVPRGGQDSAGDTGPAWLKPCSGRPGSVHGQHMRRGVCCDSSSISTEKPSRLLPRTWRRHPN